MHLFVLVFFWLLVAAAVCHFVLLVATDHPRTVEWTLSMRASALVGRMVAAGWAAWLLWG